MKKIRIRLKRIFSSIQMKITLIFMLLLLATIEIIGAYFTRQMEQTSIENFQTTIQLQTIVTDQLTNQLVKNGKTADRKMNQIITDYNNDAISEIQVIDNKNVIRAVSNLNDKDRVGQLSSNSDVREVINVGQPKTMVINSKKGNYMVQIVPLTSGTNIVGAVYVRASMATVFANLRNISLMFLTATLLAVLVAAVASLFISRQLPSQSRNCASRPCRWPTGTTQLRSRSTQTTNLASWAVPSTPCQPESSGPRSSLNQKDGAWTRFCPI